jgi:hypothetical protein
VQGSVIFSFRAGVTQYTVSLQTEPPGFDPWQRQRIFPLASVSRPALKSAQPPIQWVLRGPFPGVKVWPGRDADHSLQSSAEVKNESELYLLSPWCLHGIAGHFYFFHFIWLHFCTGLLYRDTHLMQFLQTDQFSI